MRSTWSEPGCSAWTLTYCEQHIERRIAWLIDKAASEQVSPRDVAVPLALRRFEEMRRQYSGETASTGLGRLQRIGQRLQARGLVPKRFSAALVRRYLAKSLAW